MVVLDALALSLPVPSLPTCKSPMSCFSSRLSSVSFSLLMLCSSARLGAFPPPKRLPELGDALHQSDPLPVLLPGLLPELEERLLNMLLPVLLSLHPKLLLPSLEASKALAVQPAALAS